jgi:acyl-CoA synthetase (AMP-forming)/AMP-acid ligase II
MSGARPAIPGGGPQSVAELLDPVLAEDPAREALVGRSGTYSYAELDRAANRAAGALAALGVGPGDRVSACLPNDVDIVIAFLGAMRLGAIWVGVNKPLAPPEKAYLLRDSGARLLVADPESAAQVRGQGVQVAVVELEAWRAEVARAPDTRRRGAIDPFAPAAIAYTSGTTGFPKGAVHSQHNLLLPGAVARLTGAYGPEVRQGVLLPLTILNLMVLVPVLAFYDRSTCVCIDRVDPLGIAEWVRTARVGHFAAVPTIYHDLLTHPGVRRGDLASLIRPEVGGAECPEEFRRLYRERFGAEVCIGYGMTEAPTAVARSDGRSAPLPGLCGRALPQLELSIRGEDDRELPAGEVGEICVGPARSGPFAGVYTPMLGYWNKPEETARALRGGVYHSGDLGFLDAEGNLFIRGRRNELILRGGSNVYPAEVERVLRAHAAVADCAVLGRADVRLGQRVVAAIVLCDGAVADAAALESHCRAELARYKVPEAFRFVSALPRNAMGKVVKRELERLFEET